MGSALLDFSHAVLALSRMAEMTALDDFPGALMSLLGQHVEFDGGVFGFAEPLSFGDFSIAEAHVHQRDQSILEDYASVSAIDPMTRAFLAGPSEPLIVDAEVAYAAPELAPMLALTRRHRLRHLLLCGSPPQWDRAGRWVVLYRADDRPFEPAAGAWLQAFWVHIDRAIALNRAHALALWSQGAGQRAAALVDAAGTLTAADERFAAWLRERFGQEALHRLPAPLMERMRAGQAYEDPDDVVQFKAVGHHYFCELREAGAARHLSQRERQVARRFAQGASGKEIARELGLSPYTVQSHLASIYRKLNVSDKAALAQLLNGAV